MSSIALHLSRLTAAPQSIVIQHSASARGYLRFAAHRQRALPFTRGAALTAFSAVFTTRTLIAPGMRVGRVLRQLCCAVGAGDVLLRWSARRSRRRTHGEDSTRSSLLKRAGVFGEAETEIWRRRWGYGSLASFPSFRNFHQTTSSGAPDRWRAIPEAYADHTRPLSLSISRRARLCRMRSTTAFPRLYDPLWALWRRKRQLFGSHAAAR